MFTSKLCSISKNHFEHLIVLVHMSNILIHLMLAFCELMIMDLLLQMKKFLILKKRFWQLLCISFVHCYLVA